MDGDDKIESLIVETLESAGISGLCREGCLELAVDRLRRAHPEIDGAAAWALVHAVDGKLNKRD